MVRIDVNTDSSLRGVESLDQSVHGLVGGALGRFADRLTFVRVYLSDLNGQKTRGRDKRVVIEARARATARSLTVSHVGHTFASALVGARRKLVRQLDDVFERVHAMKRRPA